MSVVKVLSGTNIIFPEDSDSRAGDAQISMPTSDLMAVEATGKPSESGYYGWRIIYNICV